MKTPEEIKKALEQCVQLQGCRNCPYNGERCVVELSNDVIAYIQQLERERDAAVENQPKWISVEERLPKGGQIVFAHTHYFYEVLQWDEKAELWIDAYRSYLKNHVTHWMARPEPPKENA